MLLVILGAGASYDSSPRNPTPLDRSASPSLQPLRSFLPSDGNRPPLVGELFDQHRPQFPFIARYPAASAIVGTIQRRIHEENLEHILGELQLEEGSYPDRKLHLMAIRFYLRDFLRDCSERWWESHDSVTVYSEFVDRLNETACERLSGCAISVLIMTLY